MKTNYLQVIQNVRDKMSNYENYIVLINRTENLLYNNDFAGVLHSCASIIETIAKDVLKNNTNINNKSLGSFMNMYKNKSNLSADIFESVKKIYEKRNKEPLSGHGSVTNSSISREEALIVFEVTKMIINIEFNTRHTGDTDLILDSAFFNQLYEETEFIDESILWLSDEDKNNKYFNITPFRLYDILHNKHRDDYFIIDDKGFLSHPFPSHKGFLLKKRDNVFE